MGIAGRFKGQLRHSPKGGRPACWRPHHLSRKSAGTIPARGARFRVLMQSNEGAPIDLSMRRMCPTAMNDVRVSVHLPRREARSGSSQPLPTRRRQAVEERELLFIRFMVWESSLITMSKFAALLCCFVNTFSCFSDFSTLQWHFRW